MVIVQSVEQDTYTTMVKEYLDKNDPGGEHE